MSTRPTVAPKLSQDARHRYTLAFDTAQADLYHGVRPGYQPEILDFLTHQHPGLAVDLGAGTGLFSAQLVAAGWDVVAVDPAANMLSVLAQEYPEVDIVVSRVETLDTAQWQAQLVVAAQAWHWIDTVEGCLKVAELLADDGVFGIVHHQIDTSEAWVLRLCKIMHSGDIHPAGSPPEVTSCFTQPKGKWWYWEQPLSVEQIHQLMMSRAFYLRTHDKQRQRMHENLNWYLLEHLGFEKSATIRIPYVTSAWRMQRAKLGASA
ncbi:MAG TPA: class I SAM-dependent methyltransferase [Candidatus Yaniella excrementavium]|nr:class I SAM-dependent methyltransferase [Candidatus Yaniella excrementavium]